MKGGSIDFSKKEKGLSEIVLSTVIWGSIPVLAVWSYLPSPIFVFFRVVISSAVLYFLLRKELRSTYNFLSDPFIILSGLLLAANWVFLFYAVNLIPVSEAIIFYYSGPVIAILLSPLVKERISTFSLINILLSFSGILIMSVGTLYLNPLGLISAVLSGITYGLLSIVSKHSSRYVNPINLVFFQVLISSFVLFPFILIIKFSFSVNDAYIAIFSAFVQTVLALFLWYDSMKNLNVQIVSIMSYLDPVFAIIFALAFLKQVPNTFTLTGGSFLIGSGLLTTIIALRDKMPHPQSGE